METDISKTLSGCKKLLLNQLLPVHVISNNYEMTLRICQLLIIVFLFILIFEVLCHKQKT